ncbi:MAG TPA: glycosyltransferase [Patescibacteria group bacterium]|nr:glycosyltransferase [Patescibacteria group bacterium]
MKITPIVSVIIPSRVEEYLQKTVDDVLTKAKEDIEVIVVLDGYWPKVPLKDDSRVTVLHRGTVHNSYGMRTAINDGIALSKGKYIMKIDEHCMIDEGYDAKLVADCEDNWVVIPRRFRLDPDKWEIIEDGRPPIDYMFLDYPYKTKGDVTDGLHGNEWRQMHYDRKDVLIDDTMSWQGSCWFMKKSYWDSTIGPLDTDLYGTFTHESQEIGNKAWLSGGRLVVNKKTWYAHFHKGSKGKGYGFSTEQYKIFSKEKERGRQVCIDYWINNKWKDRKYDFEWLIQKFWPVPNWPENWKEQIKIDAKYDFSKVGEKGFWLT